MGRRKQPLASLDAGDKRITGGCINVSQTFDNTVVRPTFEKCSVFYVLPDTKTIETAFLACDQRVFVASATEANTTSDSTLVAC